MQLRELKYICSCEKQRKEKAKMLNTILIKKRMLELNLNQEELARKTGMSQSSLNMKLNNVSPIYLEQAMRLQEILEIQDSEFKRYFFYTSSCEKQRE